MLRVFGAKFSNRPQWGYKQIYIYIYIYIYLSLNRDIKTKKNKYRYIYKNRTLEASHGYTKIFNKQNSTLTSLNRDM